MNRSILLIVFLAVGLSACTPSGKLGMTQSAFMFYAFAMVVATLALYFWQGERVLRAIVQLFEKEQPPKPQKNLKVEAVRASLQHVQHSLNLVKVAETHRYGILQQELQAFRFQLVALRNRIYSLQKDTSLKEGDQADLAGQLAQVQQLMPQLDRQIAATVLKASPPEAQPATTGASA